MALVSFGHMFSQCRMVSFARTPPMRRDPFTFIEAFDRRGGETHVHGLAHEAMGNTVEMPLDFEMIIQMDSCVPPFGIFVGSRGQWLEGGLFIHQKLRVTRAG